MSILSNQLSSELYDGAAKVSVFGAYVRVGFASFIFLILLFISYLIYTNDKKYNGNAYAYVQDTKCNTTYTNNKSSTTCSLDIIYDIGNQRYNNKINTNIKYNKGDTLNIRYDNNNRYDITNNGSPIMGIVIMLVIGVLILGASLIHLYTVKNFKFIAAAETATSLVSGVSNSLFRPNYKSNTISLSPSIPLQFKMF
jgi:hypothetical protein